MTGRTEPKDSAAGTRAVTVAMEYALREMGPVRTPHVLSHINQPDGFDCPSCAWPEPKDHGPIEFCENGAKASAWEATQKTIDGAFFARHSIAELAAQSDHWLEAQGRLAEPLYKAPGAAHYVPVSWDDALTTIATSLNGLDDPNRAVFYTSGRASNEAAFLYQLFVRKFGTNNLPDCSNMCHESSGVALGRTIGIGKGTVSIEDITDHAELIIVVGQNPGTNHPRMLTALEKAKKRGARIIGINPLKEAGLSRFKNPQKPSGVVGRGTKIADLHVPVSIGGDQALFALINRSLVERDERLDGRVLDHEFIETHTAGFAEARAAWLSYDREALLAQTGLTQDDVERIVDETIGARSVIVCWAMGITQHPNGVATIEEFSNFLLLRGNIGRPGAGACPVRGHSNVQGDRTMGIFEKMPEKFLAALDDEFGFTSPRDHGVDSVDAIRAMHDRKVDFFMGLGGNFAQATPDTERTHEALRSVKLIVQVSTKLNRSHLVHGDSALILPCLGRTDIDERATGPQRVTVEDSMGMIHASRGVVSPGSPDQRSEVAIICALASAVLGPDDSVPWADFAEDYDLIRERIERVVPGFDDFNERIRQPGGFALPNGPRDSRTFATDTGKANFRTTAPLLRQLEEGQLLLQTVRSHDQYNTTVYGLDDRYRGVKGRRDVVFVNQDDLAARGLRNGDRIDVVSYWDDGERWARGLTAIAYPTPRGSAAAYFPEANVLVPLDSTADESNTPTSKAIVVRLVAASAS